MTRVLIVDAYKSSLVMTSEVFKDKIIGTTIDVAHTGEASLELLSKNEYDCVVVDFDLPDTDGVTLTKLVRRTYAGPILLTAYPDKIVNEAVNSELFPYADSSMWIPKPIRFEALAAKLDMFMIEKRRLRKRFQTDIDAIMVGKGAGRGKRAPKNRGTVTNLSIGGALIELADSMKLKVADEIIVTLELPVVAPNQPLSKERTAILAGPSKIKARVCWTNRKAGQVGIEFEPLSDTQRRSVEAMLFVSEEIATN